MSLAVKAANNYVNTNTSPLSFEDKKAIFQKKTGNTIVVPENGEMPHILSEESAIQLGFFGEFMRVGFTSPNGHIEAVENLSRRFAEMRDELLEKYKDDQDTLYKRLGELNQAFESALQSTALVPIPPMPPSPAAISGSPEAIAAENAHREFEALTNLVRKLQDSMTKHMDTFFESFINNIKNQDFQTAFDGSMGQLLSGESQSLTDMSFGDAVRIKDRISTWYTQNAGGDNETVQMVRHNVSFMSIVGDESISEVVRREIAALLGIDFTRPDTTAAVQAAATSGVTNETESQVQRYTRLLLEGIQNGPGNGNTGSSPMQILNNSLFNIALTFNELLEQSDVNNTVLEGVFRNMVRQLFDDAALGVHARVDNAEELPQIREDARELSNTFLNRFFRAIREITAQNLRDTGMGRMELAFHEAWNYTYHEVGMALLGGTDAVAGEPVRIGLDGRPLPPIPTEAEFRRQMMEHMLWVMRENQEVYRQWAEMHREEMERWRKIMLIASRIAAGHNVPPQDREFLAANSPGMYMIANAAQNENENPRDYDSVLSEDDQEEGYGSQGGEGSSSGASSSSSSSSSTAGAASSGGVSAAASAS